MHIEVCLFQAGLLSKKQLQSVIEESKITNTSATEILVSRGDIKQQTVDYFINNFSLIPNKVSLHNRHGNNSDRKLSLASIYIHPPTVSKILLGIIVLLLILSIGEKLAIAQLNQLTATEFTTRFFGFDEEANFPTLYSFVTLAICSGLLAIISAIVKITSFQLAKSWRALSFIFLFLAVDEACSIHEILIPLIKIVVDTRGLLYFPWVIPASVLLIIFLFLFRHFIYNLPKKTRNLFLLAGGIYIGGALVMEIIGAYLVDLSGLDTTAYWLAATVEELLEMFGILIFIREALNLESYP